MIKLQKAILKYYVFDVIMILTSKHFQAASKAQKIAFFFSNMLSTLTMVQLKAHNIQRVASFEINIHCECVEITF